MKKTILSFAMLAMLLPTLCQVAPPFLAKVRILFLLTVTLRVQRLPLPTKKDKDVFKGQTPATAILKSGAGYFSKAEYQVKLSSPGFEEQIIPINFKLNGWYFGNILIGGILGLLIIDPATGAMWKLDTPPLNVTLNKSTAISNAPTLQIVDIANIPSNVKEQLVRVK